ncbi:MAG: hypothetical protein HDQ88_12085 [Clostridia bacterium]|nr:hypothetical protein [Clostridia bacterium]
MIDANNLEIGTYIPKEQDCWPKPLEPTPEMMAALGNSLINEQIQTRMWKAVAEKLAEAVEIACCQLPYYDGKKAEDFIADAKKYCGYE